MVILPLGGKFGKFSPPTLIKTKGFYSSWKWINMRNVWWRIKELKVKYLKFEPIRKCHVSCFYYFIISL